MALLLSRLRRSWECYVTRVPGPYGPGYLLAPLRGFIGQVLCLFGFAVVFLNFLVGDACELVLREHGDDPDGQRTI